MTTTKKSGQAQVKACDLTAALRTVIDTKNAKIADLRAALMIFSKEREAELQTEIARLRAALERIANGTHPAIDGGSPFEDAQALAREALK
jgi:hypothetical protein